MRPGHSRAVVLAVVAATALAACSSFSRKEPEPATLKSLASREAAVQPDAGVPADEEAAARAYREFLAAAPREPQRQEALRRLGDLEMDRVDTRVGSGAASGTAADYKAAIGRYQDFLKTYPNDPGNDRVLYQLARAHELSGDLETSLKTLDRLVQAYPATRYREEAQFRRGELMFTLRDYPNAEKAYAITMQGDRASPFHERSLYMHGWSLFKQGRLEDSLQSFFRVLDLKLAGRGNEGDLAKVPGLTRADRELVEDTFRVTSLSLSNLQGAGVDPAVHHHGRAPRLRVPRVPAARRALHQAGAGQGRRRHLRRLRAARAVASRGAGAAGARDRHLRRGRLREPGPRGEEAVRVATTASAATTSAPTRKAGRAASRW